MWIKLQNKYARKNCQFKRKGSLKSYGSFERDDIIQKKMINLKNKR